MKIGVIAGSGLENLSLDLQSGIEVHIIERHGANHDVLPHAVDYRANIMAMKNFGAEYIISTSAVGSLNKKFKPGELHVLSDFIDFTKQRPLFLSERAAVMHPDMSNPYSKKINEFLKASIKVATKQHPSEVVYVAVEGPRFETKAEIKMFSKLGGDVIGMTNVPEVLFATEAGIPYASLAIVTNYGCGISGTPITHEEVETMMNQKRSEVSKVLSLTINALNRGV